MLTLPILHRNDTYTVHPSKIIGIGLNYRDHVAEDTLSTGKNDLPTEPVIFPMTPNVLIGDGEHIPLPRLPGDDPARPPRVDYEAELAFFVKEECKHVPTEQALEYVWGYTCMNDVSRRDIQKGDVSGWFRGKSFDGFGPVGPGLVLAEDLPDPQNLDIRCRLNGKEVQASNTRHMIFTVAEILSYLSHQFTLMPGDLVCTGTPSGVGPIQPGDVVEVEIEGIGTLRNPVSED